MQKFGSSVVQKFDYVVLFVLNALEMILELVAARLLSPYFGNSNFVWTAIIGIILLSASIGNLIGGRLAKLKNVRLWVSLLLLFASAYIAMTPLIDVPVLQSIKDGDMGVQFSSVISSVVFFLIPSSIMGIVSPVIMKERIGEGEDKAKESGRITAIIAIGSLFGTFLGGFWLIPALGTKLIFAMIAIVLTMVILLFCPLRNVTKKELRVGYVLGFLVVLLLNIFAIISVINQENKGISIDTEYGRIIVEEGERNGETVLFYKQSGAYASATYMDDRKYELVFDYLKKYDMMFDFIDVKNVAMIGGAAYQYPKYYISHFPDKTMDVIEIDPMSTEIAKKYFYLDDLISDYGEDRLGLYNEDGRVFLAETDKKYDAVLNDAFSGEVPVGTLATVEAAKVIKNKLNAGGVYISNVLGAVSGDKGKFLRAEVKTLKTVFKHVYVVKVHKKARENSYINWMVVATDNDDCEPEDVMELNLSDEDIVLTDDYNPVDSLVTTSYHD